MGTYQNNVFVYMCKIETYRENIRVIIAHLQKPFGAGRRVLWTLTGGKNKIKPMRIDKFHVFFSCLVRIWISTDYKLTWQDNETKIIPTERQRNAECGRSSFSAPTIPSMPWGSSSTMPLCLTHLAWPELMNWSMMHWAVLWKSPNWASHRTSALGLAMAKPSSKPAHRKETGTKTEQLQINSKKRLYWHHHTVIQNNQSSV